MLTVTISDTWIAIFNKSVTTASEEHGYGTILFTNGSQFFEDPSQAFQILHSGITYKKWGEAPRYKQTGKAARFFNIRFEMIA